MTEDCCHIVSPIAPPMRQEDPMKKSLAAACLLLLVHSLPCRAADTSSLPPPITAVSTILELSDEQVQSLISMIGARDAALGPLVAELQRHQGALEKLLQAPDADAATVGQLVLETRTLNA